MQPQNSVFAFFISVMLQVTELCYQCHVASDWALLLVSCCKWLSFVIIVMLQVTELCCQCHVASDWALLSLSCYKWLSFENSVLALFYQRKYSVVHHRHTRMFWQTDCHSILLKPIFFYGGDITSRLVSWLPLSWIFLLCDGISKRKLHRTEWWNISKNTKCKNGHYNFQFTCKALDTK
jgi:hypothetical protein